MVHALAERLDDRLRKLYFYGAQPLCLSPPFKKLFLEKTSTAKILQLKNIGTLVIAVKNQYLSIPRPGDTHSTHQ
jgi:hypothetical protein